MSERSITIILWNHTKFTLSHIDISATSGTVALPSGVTGSTLSSTISLPPEGFMKFVASNSNGGCVGTMTLSDGVGGSVVFPVNYVHPSTNDPTTVTVQPDTRYPACMGQNDQDSLAGHDVTVNTGLYVGCPVPTWSYDNEGRVQRKTAGYAVPLLGYPYYENNPRDLVNSLFQPAVRGVGTVQLWFDQADAAPYQPADFSGGQLAVNNSADPLAPIPVALKNLWPGVVHNPNTSSPDYPFIKFIADFLVPESTSATNAPLVMYVPKFVYQRNYTSSDETGPVYQLTGYQAYPFAGAAPEGGGTPPRFDMRSVDVFLQLLVGGAHFVNIQANRDFTNLNPTNPPANTGRDLYAMFKNQFPDNNTMSGRRSCPGNSHYAALVNTSGWYYGNQTGEWAASGCGLLLSLLVAKTADGQYDTFMQLEGWPAESGSLTGGDRHKADYDAYKKSYWNISTFGSAPYSEKRATTIFLAPAVWTPSIYSKTYMMPYVGAETPQGWLMTEFVSVPAGTPAPPKQYGG